ncbi:MAG: hypothetical protein JW894_06080 [Bacteroidales bacterium]|nr:hypothetical protein [Bacteroidales bacterium]
MRNILKLYKDTRYFYRESSDNKSIFRIIFELIFWIWLNNRVIIEYFFIGLHQKGNRLQDFIARKEFNRIHNKLNPIYYRAVLEDKFVFDKYMEGSGSPVIPLLGRIENERIYFKNNLSGIKLDDIVNLTLHCFCKLNTGYGGLNVFKLDVEDKKIKINNKASTLADLKKIVSKGVYVVQNTIIQHPEMNKLNDKCVNTLRILTISDGETFIYLGGFLRIGIGDSVADNTTKGNLTCGWNESGKLSEKAFEFIPKRKFHTHHPNSKAVFKDFQIPFFKDAINLVEETHKQLPFFFIIAWDVAISDKGLAIIEANPVPDISFIQSYYGGLRQRIRGCAYSFAAIKHINL